MRKILIISLVLIAVLFGQYEGWDNSNFRILDNKNLYLGTNDDIGLYYDETTSDVLVIGGNGKTNNEDLTFDFESVADQITITSSTAVATLIWDEMDNFKILSTTTSKPSLVIENNTDDATGSYIYMRNYRGGGNGVANDVLGNQYFGGRDNAGNGTNYIQITGYADYTVNGDESGRYEIQMEMDNSTASFMDLDAYNGTVGQGYIVFNEDSKDVDFRIEADAISAMFFVDAGDGRVGIGTDAPNALLDVSGLNEEIAVTHVAGTVTINETIGRFRTWGAEDGTEVAVGGLTVKADNDWTATSSPTYAYIATTPSGSKAETEAVRWDSNQNQTNAGNLFLESSTSRMEVTRTEAGSATSGGRIVLQTNDGAATGSGHRLGNVAFRGAEDASGVYHEGATIEALTTETWSASQNGTEIIFKVTPNGATSMTTALTIDNSANSTFGGTITSTGNITCNEGILSAIGTENDIGHLQLWADQGDDNADKWRHVANTDGTYDLATFADGSYSSKFTSAGGANGLITLSGGTDGVRVDNTLGINTVPNANVQLAIDPTITGSTTSMRGINLNGSYTYSSASDFYGFYEANTVVLANGLHSNITNSYYGTMTVTEHGSGSTITNLAQIYVKGAPTYSGAGGDITNGPYAIFVDAGTSRFDGEVISQTQFTVGANGVASGTLRFIASDGDNVDVVINTSDQLQFQGASGGVDVDGAFTANTINGLSLSGTGAMDIASGATVDIDKGLTVNGDFGTTLTGYGQANTITLYESLTLSDGFNMLLVAEDAQSTITMDEANFEVEGEGTSSQLMKLVNANNAAATVTVEGTAAILNQDVTSDATVTFGGVIVADGGDIYAGTNGDEENWLNLEIYCDSTVTGETTLSSVLPAGYAIDNIIVKNTTANEITALDVGFTDGGGEVVAAANFLASDEASLTILQRIDDFDAADTLYLSATNWNSANLIIYIRMVRYF